MIKREAFSVNAERLKEIMAKETSADGTPKKSRIEEDTQIPQRQDVPEKSLVAPRKTDRTVSAIAEKVEKYEMIFLSRKESVHRKQTYISYETYRKLARILPLLSERMTVPVFLDNVLDHHLMMRNLVNWFVVIPKIHFNYGTDFYLPDFGFYQLFVI